LFVFQNEIEIKFELRGYKRLWGGPPTQQPAEYLRRDRGGLEVYSGRKGKKKFLLRRSAEVKEESPLMTRENQATGVTERDRELVKPPNKQPPRKLLEKGVLGDTLPCPATYGGRGGKRQKGDLSSN